MAFKTREQALRDLGLVVAEEAAIVRTLTVQECAERIWRPGGPTMEELIARCASSGLCKPEPGEEIPLPSPTQNRTGLPVDMSREQRIEAAAIIMRDAIEEMGEGATGVEPLAILPSTGDSVSMPTRSRRDGGNSVAVDLRGWLSPTDVCELIPGMTVTLLQRMRDEGRGPRYAKPSPKTVVYARSDIDAYVRSTTVPTRDQPGSA